MHCSVSKVLYHEVKINQIFYPGVSMSVDVLNEIYEEIYRRNNLQGWKAVPQSDEFIKYISAYIGVGKELAEQIIQVLINSHKIFSIDIISEDATKNIPSIQGYVVADLVVVRKLKNFFQNELVVMYEKQYNKHLMVHQVVKDVFPMLRSLNNTEIGQVANLAIMLDEFERFMEKRYEEFTDKWKDDRLRIEMDRANISQKLSEKTSKAKDKTFEAKVAPKATGGRAVDSKKYSEFTTKSKQYPLERILQIYGIDFFVKVQLRNYKFDYLAQLIEDGQIQKRSDLLLIKDMLESVKRNFSRDSKLGNYRDKVYNLERTVNHHLYFSPRKK